MAAAVMESRLRTAEAILEPLFKKLSSFSSLSVKHHAKKPRSKSQSTIISSVQEFLNDVEFRANCLIRGFPSMETDFNTALNDVLDTGQIFLGSVVSFTSDPTNINKDTELYQSGNVLLSALCRLLILAEVADISLLDQLITSIRNRIEHVINTPSSRKLQIEWRELEKELANLVLLLEKRLPDLLNREHQEKLSRAKFILKNSGPLLYTSSRVCLHHPEHTTARSARDFAAKSLDTSIALIQSTIDPGPKPGKIRLKVSGKLLDEIGEFENSTLLDPDTFDDKQARAQMERQLKRLLPSVYQLADARQTRPSTRQAIYAQCKKIQRVLEDLLTEYNRKPPVNRFALDQAMETLLNTTGALKQQLLRISVDHATQALMRKDEPLMALSDATKFGSEKRMDTACQVFQEHSADLVLAAYEMCALTSNEELSKSIQLACHQMEQLRPQVVNTGYLLFKFPYSKSIAANFEAFKQSYQESIDMLATALNELTSVHDFLAVADDGMREDYQKSLQALAREKLSEQTDNLDYVDHVMETVILLRDKYTPTFIEVSRDTLSRLAAHHRVDEARYRHAGSDLCSALHEVRLAALNESNLPSELEALRLKEAISDFDADRRSTNGSRSVKVTSSDQRSPGHEFRPSSAVSQENRHSERAELYAMLSGPERETMAQEFAGFLEEKKRFMREVVKWDDSANEIIVLAKKMCIIMMEMTDFTRGRGPLNSTMEVIQAAQRISECGQRLDQLCRDIANLCPDSASRRDLLAYLQRVTLHCHQLNITSRVKAGVQAARSEVVENSAALIQAARNLMTAVVLTVKQSFIASTKYRNPEGQHRPVVRWQMRAPDKKPLVTPEHEMDDVESGSDIGDLDEDDIVRPLHARSSRRSDALIELAQFDHPLTPVSRNGDR
ncbi:Catenin alpha-3 [Fasciola gigantica]|uniref:Catenin alpha-3 n=1 Tax=Fasciola gigantica TaxID=46835 RepID=A0A504Z5H1_FASGI|nr:Catenin alpha-3 [Fasciola gigantica]